MTATPRQPRTRPHWRTVLRVAGLVAFILVAATHLPSPVARFWRDFLDYRVAPNHSSSVLLVRNEQPQLLIQPATEQIEPGAIHLDLRPEDQAACVARAIELGARRAEIGQTGEEGFTVLADPEGNEFCILHGR